MEARVEIKCVSGRKRDKMYHQTPRKHITNRMSEHETLLVIESFWDCANFENGQQTAAKE